MRPGSLATIEEIRAAVKEQKDDFVASISSEFAAMKEESATELRAELKTFAQEEIAKNSGLRPSRQRLRR